MLAQKAPTGLAVAMLSDPYTADSQLLLPAFAPLKVNICLCPDTIPEQHLLTHYQKAGSSPGCNGTWIPHSTLSQPFQRPERGSSPGATLLVQGAQPIDR